MYVNMLCLEHEMVLKWFCFHRWRGNLELNQIGFLWVSPYIVRGLGLLVLFLNKNLIGNSIIGNNKVQN